MSGGVDSAVALLRAGPKAVGVTLRLWLDPKGPDSERACCSPAAVVAARETCHGLGLPHVTLDLREEFRRERGRSRSSRATRAVRRRTPASAATARFRFDELLAFARRAGAARLATGHYARIVERDGRLLLARAADADKDQSYMLAALDPRHLPRLWFPLGDQGKDETRAEAARAGLAAAARAESQEACFLAGDDYRSFLERHGLDVERGAGRRHGGPRARTTRGLLALHARPAEGARRGDGHPALRAPDAPRREHASSSGRARRSRARGSARAAGCTRRSSASRRSSATARRRSRPRCEPSARGFGLRLERPAYGVAKGQAAVLYDDDAVVGMGRVSATVSAS